MSFRKKALKLVKRVLGIFVLLAVMGGSFYLVYGDRWSELGRYVPFIGAASQASAKVPQAATDNSQKKPTRASVKLNVAKQQLIGVTTSKVGYARLKKSIRTVGKVVYDETRITDVNLKVGGWIEKLFVNYTGKLIKKGQPLLTLYSPDLVTTQQEYLLALQTREKVKKSHLPDAVQGAEALIEAGRRRLLLWDITEEQVRELARTGKPKTYLTIESPVAGFVIRKSAVEKMYVKPGMSLYRIADISTVWIEADIYESEMPFIKVGQRAAITLPYDSGKTLRGRIDFIYPFLEPKTRTVKVRFSFPNPGLRLKPEMYANVDIHVKAGMRLAIPESAVLRSGLRNLVFVAKGKGLFEPREVKLGPRLDRRYVVLKGVSSGERVVTSANFFVDSESRLMAATGGMKGMMSLIGMGDAPMAGAAMGDGGMDGMEGMKGMNPKKGMEGMKGTGGMKDMQGMEGMEGMEPAKGMGNMEGMEGMEGMEADK